MPEHTEERAVLRRLADVEATEAPVLSLYLDMRPQATGQRPAVRSGLVVLKDRLHEIEKTLGPRGPDLDSFRSDVIRVEAYLDNDVSAATQGLALFACAQQNLFEAVEAGVEFENQVTAAPLPDLYQLARLLDQQEVSVVAVVDSNTARLFVTRAGLFEEVGGPDEASDLYPKRSKFAWSQARYQRKVESHRADFAGEVASEIERLVHAEGAARVILAGDEVAIPLLRGALSPQVTALVCAEVPRIDIRALKDDVREEISPILAQAEADDARIVADRLVGAVRGGGLGTSGLEHTRSALEQGQVDLLVLSNDAHLSRAERDELVRLAAVSDAGVEVVEGHALFNELGGVGALLRYRTDQASAAAA